MASKKPIPSSDPRQFWQAAYVVALRVVLAQYDGARLVPTAAAHLAAEIADEALVEWQRRYGRPS